MKDPKGEVKGCEWELSCPFRSASLEFQRYRPHVCCSAALTRVVS